MMIEKDGPSLAGCSARTCEPDVFLDACGSDLQIQFEEFPSNLFSPLK
jgi:hypothetical protein